MDIQTHQLDSEVSSLPHPPPSLSPSLPQSINQSVYYRHVSGEIYMRLEWGMVFKALIIMHTYSQ